MMRPARLLVTRPAQVMMPTVPVQLWVLACKQAPHPLAPRERRLPLLALRAQEMGQAERCCRELALAEALKLALPLRQACTPELTPRGLASALASALVVPWALNLAAPSGT